MKYILTQVDIEYDYEESGSISTRTDEFDDLEEMAARLGFSKDTVVLNIGEDKIKEYICKYSYYLSNILKKVRPNPYDTAYLSSHELTKVNGKWEVTEKANKVSGVDVSIPIEDIIHLFPDLKERLDTYKKNLVTTAKKKNEEESVLIAKREERKKARILKEAKELGLNVTVE